MVVGSSPKSATWLPLPWTRWRSPLRHVASLITPGRETFHHLRVLYSQRLPPDGRGRRFNFPGQTCPDPPVTLTRRTSAADDLASPGSLARQTLVIRRIHFRPQSKSKLRQYWRPNLLNCHSSLMPDTFDKTFPNLLILLDASPVLKIINWGDIRCLNTLLTAVTSHHTRYDCFATLWAVIMTMGPASTARPYSLTHI